LCGFEITPKGSAFEKFNDLGSKGAGAKTKGAGFYTSLTISGFSGITDFSGISGFAAFS
jgi:hypothetical protein